MSKLIHNVKGPKIGRELFAQNMGYSYKNKDSTLIGRSTEEILTLMIASGLELQYTSAISGSNLIDENIIEVDHYGRVCNPKGTNFEQMVRKAMYKFEKINITNHAGFGLKVMGPFLLEQALTHGCVNSNTFFDDISTAYGLGFVWIDSRIISINSPVAAGSFYNDITIMNGDFVRMSLNEIYDKNIVVY